MTTLRTFQDDIEKIHHQEVVKQRAKALVEKEKEKDTAKKVEREKGKDIKKAEAESAAPASVVESVPPEDYESDVNSLEEKIQASLHCLIHVETIHRLTLARS